MLLVLGGLALLVPPDQPWSADDGAYHHAVRLVREEGRWYEERPELDLVEHPGRYPLALSDVDEAGRAFPYVKHPGWILALVGSTTAFGDVWGLVIPGLAAVAVAATLAWRLSRRLDIAASPLAFWLVALGPLAIIGLGYWAHTVAAALGGIAALLLYGLARRPSLVAASLLGAVGATLVLVRSEGVLLVAALTGALVIARIGQRAAARGWLDPIIVLALPAMAYVAEKAWVASLVEGQLVSTEPPDRPVGWLDGRVSGAWHTFGAHSPGSSGHQLVLWAATGLVVVGLATWAHRGLWPRACVAAGVLLTLILAGWGSLGLVSGIVPAWPALVAGLVVLVGRRTGHRPEVRALAITCLIYTALVLATQYPTGGGIDWGGRFMAPVAVPLAVLSALGLVGAVSSTPEGSLEGRRGLVGAVVMSAVAVAVLGLIATGDARSEVDAILADVRAASPDVAVAAKGSFVARYDLRGASPAWVRADGDGLDAAVERAFAGGAGRVAVVGRGARDVSVPGTRSTAVGGSVALLTRGP
ncbi:hypothetical protein HC251_13340 [Iamia sp. SCSIO 61187]|uniref:hypothetical protein n=1 Tax=Iamia sp. SCSIO 61187 TaxID=2722752 RepID=UPI001C635357|nr:hypothetical protein [Iamia sp. SCSIO 61187]QYG93310.1 hypothetical protein HC251_13340 [Iamia sp. SCSIO 61187]